MLAAIALLAWTSIASADMNALTRVVAVVIAQTQTRVPVFPSRATTVFGPRSLNEAHGTHTS
jgi:hypothetical protein